MIATLNSPGVTARGIDDVIDALSRCSDYRARAKYEVVMPAFSQPIIYDITLAANSAPGDTLARCDYLIDWKVPTPSGDSEGFSAYHDGNHYRFRDNRLQEYHLQWDSIPFGLGRAVSSPSLGGGVQNNAQFTEILPHYIAAQLSRIKTDSTYSYRFVPDSLVNGDRMAVIEALQRHKGYDCREITYFFDAAGLMPTAIEIENNPGSIGEQTVTVKYTPLEPGPTDYTEKGLISRYPDAFGKYRLSYFKVENLPGTPLPGFSAPTPTGERYSRATGDRFRSPTLLVFLDPKVGSATATIADIRTAVDKAPLATDVIWVFTSNNTGEIDNLIPMPREGEHIVMSARQLARDCGVTTFPITLFCGRDGNISDVGIGYNKNLVADVIQKTVIAEKRE